jgi:nucleoside-diphosphate-sugar epimerase/CBS domain-containing protein
MKKVTVKDITISNMSTIKHAMRVIDTQGLRTVYVLDGNKKLLGVITDSEIRKGILKGLNINDSINDIVNLDPIVLKEKDLNNEFIVEKISRELLKVMPDSSYILVVDQDNYPKAHVPLSSLAPSNNVKKKISNIKNILIVGGAGYLGCLLVQKLLLKGYNVHILDSLMYGSSHLKNILKNKKVKLITDDMRNISILMQSLKDIDAVINLAAIVGDPACKENPEATIGVNYLANKALAEACKYNQVNRFIYASTCSVYGQMSGEEKLTEESPLNPVSLYARSKIQSEEALLNMEDENFAPTILRMSTLYGSSPRMRFDLVVNTMTKNAIVDRTIFVHGGGEQWRPLLHVADAADAYVKCLEAPLHKVKGQIFNVGSEIENYQILQIAEEVKNAIPNVKIKPVGEKVDSRNYVVSFAKIKKVLGYKTKKKLETSIKEMARLIKSKEIKNVNDPKYYNLFTV